MPIQTLTSPAVTAHHTLTVSQAPYDGPDEDAILDSHEANLDSLADASYRTLEAALEALRVVVADAIDCDLFGGAWRAQQRVFQAACNVAEFAPSQAH